MLSAGPTTDKSLKGFFYPDYNDPAVRGMLVVDKGQLRWPNPNPYAPPVPAPTVPAPSVPAPSVSVSTVPAPTSPRPIAPTALVPASSTTNQAVASTAQHKHKSGASSKIAKTAEQQLQMFQDNSKTATLGAMVILATAAASPDDRFSLLLSVFALSSYAGQQVQIDGLTRRYTRSLLFHVFVFLLVAVGRDNSYFSVHLL